MTDITKMYADTIKVTQLHYVRAAADLGSFSRAAASLGVTQPALSNGIGALERTLGGALFRRSTTGVTLTPLGLRVLPHLHSVLAGLDAVLTEAQAGAAQEPLRLGVSPLIHPALVARAFQAARQHAPAALVLKEDNLADLRTALLSRDLDLILVPAVTEAVGCRRRQIDSEPLHFLPSAPAAGRGCGEPVELAALSGEPLVMVGEGCGLTVFTRMLFANTGVELCPYAGVAENYGSLEDWAGLGLGGALLPRSRFRDDEATRPVHRDGTPVTIAYEALWLIHGTRGEAIETLLDAILAPADQAVVQR